MPVLFISVQMLENAEIAQVCPMSGWRSGRLGAFRISFWNKQIGSEDCVFGDQECVLGGSAKCPMSNARRCSLTSDGTFSRPCVPGSKGGQTAFYQAALRSFRQRSRIPLF